MFSLSDGYRCIMFGWMGNELLELILFEVIPVIPFFLFCGFLGGFQHMFFDTLDDTLLVS